MASRGPRAALQATGARGLPIGLLCLALLGPACEGDKVTPKELCDGFVGMLSQRLESTKSWGVTLEPGEAARQCLKTQEKYAKQNPKEFQTMARCALRADTPSGWRMCGYPRRK